MGRWVISCKEHAELASFCQDRQLTMMERLAYKVHKYLCPPCDEVKKQFESIRQACRSEEYGCDDTKCVLPDDARERMKAELAKFKG